MEELVQTFNSWADKKNQWRIKACVPQKKKTFEDAMSFQIVLFSKNLDDLFKKKKVQKSVLNGYLLFEVKSLTEDQAEKLNLLLFKLKSKGIQRHLSAMVLIYMIGYYLFDIESSLFKGTTPKHKKPRKIIIDNRDVFVNTRPLFEFDHLIALWEKEIEIPKFLKLDLVHIYIPPKLEGQLQFDQKWLSDLKDHFPKQAKEKLEKPATVESPSMLAGQAYIECDGQTELVPSKVYRVVKYLKDNKIFDAISALDQETIYSKAGVATKAAFPRIVQLWKLNGKPHPFLSVLFLTEPNTGRFFLNSKVKIIKT